MKVRTRKKPTSGELDFAENGMRRPLEVDAFGNTNDTVEAERARGVGEVRTSIPTGGNSVGVVLGLPQVLDIAPGEDIGGDVPRWEKNLVVEVYPGAVVERVDSENWQAKILRRVESRAARAAGLPMPLKWEGVGYYSSPGYAARRVLLLAAASEPGVVQLAALVDRIDTLVSLITPRVIAGERAKAIDEAAALVSDPDDAAKLRRRARDYADGTVPRLAESTRAAAMAVTGGGR